MGVRLGLSQMPRDLARPTREKGVSMRDVAPGSWVAVADYVSLPDGPAREVLDALKAARFCWGGVSWTGLASEWATIRARFFGVGR